MAGAHHREPAGTVPFWAHQLAEMLLGVLLLIEGARTGMHTAVLVGMGAALLLLSLCSDGALGAWPWIGRRLHRVLDLVAAGVLAASPLLLSLDAVLPIVILEAAAIGMVWLAVRTNWVARRPRPVRRRRVAPEPTPPERPAVPASDRHHAGTAARPQAGVGRGQGPGRRSPAARPLRRPGPQRGAGGHQATDRPPGRSARRRLRPSDASGPAPAPPEPEHGLTGAHRRPRCCVPWGWWCPCGRWGGIPP